MQASCRSPLTLWEGTWYCPVEIKAPPPSSVSSDATLTGGLVGSPCLGRPASLCCGGRRGPAVSFRGVQSDLSGYSHDTVFFIKYFLYLLRSFGFPSLVG